MTISSVARTPTSFPKQPTPSRRAIPTNAEHAKTPPSGFSPLYGVDTLCKQCANPVPNEFPEDHRGEILEKDS